MALISSCPVLDPRVEVFQLGPSGVLLRTDDSLLQFRGTGIAKFLISMNGLTTVETLAVQHGSSRTKAVLGRLHRLGVVSWVESSHGLPALNWEPNILNNVFPDQLGGKLRIVLTESYLRPKLSDDIESAVRCGHACVLLKLGLSNIWLGPVFEAQSAPCWNCFLRRLASQDDRWAILQKGVYQRRIPVTLELVSTQAVEAMTQHLGDYVAGSHSVLDQGVLLLIDVSSGHTAAHHIVPYPACPECAGSGGGSQSPSHFTVSLAALRDTVEERVGHLIDPVAGIVAELGLFSSDSNQPVQVAVARYADPTCGELCEYALDESTGRLVRNPTVLRTAFGGGQNSNDARGRAVLEAFERYSGIFQSGDEMVFASFKELGDEAVHPNQLMNYSSGQLAHPNWSVKGTPRELRVPEPFDENARIHWTRIESRSGKIRYAPTALCYDGFNKQPDASFCVYDTSGCALAFSLEDAIVHGFLELVERDAVSIWWYNRIARPIVELHSFGDGFVDRVTAQHNALGRRLTVFDVTHDLGIPVFAAVSLHDGMCPLFGFGANFDARLALASSLIELGQALCFAHEEREKWEGVDWSQQRHLMLPNTTGVRDATNYTYPPQRATVEKCADTVARVGLEFFIGNCTRADVGLPAIRVIVPGLRHVWPRLGPGRLLDVPVKLAWLCEPTAPAELNPEHLRS